MSTFNEGSSAPILSSDDDSAVVEIKHTFGPVKKSIHKVLEYDEKGMSFLVPASEGYFRPGAPLEYRFVLGDVTKIDSFGSVRYYHPYNDYNGESYYRIGVEHKHAKGDKFTKKYKIRPERYRLAGIKSPHLIHFSINGKELSLSIEDISRYSAAFYCEEVDALELNISSLLENVLISFNDRTVYHGTVTVTKKVLIGAQYRIVIEPRGAVFNIDVIEEQETLTSVTHSLGEIVSESQKFSTIDKQFRALVSDMRAFLEGTQKALEQPAAVKLANEADQKLLVNELYRVFAPRWDEYWKELDKLVARLNLSEQNQGLYRSYLQMNCHPLMMGSRFCHRIYFKPRGYPGDYEMMRMIRDKIDNSPTLFSKLVDKHALQCPLARAARNRNGLLARRIANFVSQHDSEKVRILSIAAGPSMEIEQLIEKHPEIASRIQLTLLDQDAEALGYAQNAIYKQRILNNSDIQVELVHQSVGEYLRQISRRDVGENRYDLIYAFGLFDYFDDKTCMACINGSSRLLNSNGTILISNYSLDNHYHRTFMEYAFEWYIIYRTTEQMKNLGKSIEKPCNVFVDQDPTGVIKFLELRF
jgi:hypothetical protein